MIPAIIFHMDRNEHILTLLHASGVETGHTFPRRLIYDTLRKIFFKLYEIITYV